MERGSQCVTLSCGFCIIIPDRSGLYLPGDIRVCLQNCPSVQYHPSVSLSSAGAAVISRGNEGE